jgi:hypothetical protein
VSKGNRRPVSLGRLSQDECRRDATRAVVSRTTHALAKQRRKDSSRVGTHQRAESRVKYRSRWRVSGKAGGAKEMRPGPATAVQGPSKSVGRTQALESLLESRQGHWRGKAARPSDRELRRLGKPRT